MTKVFAEDSTFLLVKKFIIYKLMASNLFINYALPGLNLAYKLFGVRLTNFIINNTAGNVFTSGNTIHSLISDLRSLEKKNI